VAKRIWFILGGAWLILSTGYFVWLDYAMTHNVAAIACGYPDTAAKGYAPCMAEKLPIADRAMWHWLATHDAIWILGPALILAAIGFLVRKRA
jgi:hypothetical protein